MEGGLWLQMEPTLQQQNGNKSTEGELNLKTCSKRALQNLQNNLFVQAAQMMKLFDNAANQGQTQS